MAKPDPDPAAATGSDPYAVLGVAKTASQAEIKSAYRRLVRTSHPDLNPDDPGAEARFVRLTAAHDLLKDPASRARFDAGEIDAKGQEKPARQYYRDFAGAEAPWQGGSGFGGGFAGGAEDIFAEILRQRGGGGGGGGGQGFARQGADQAYSLQVPFLDAALGGTAQITLPGEGSIALTIPVGLREGQTLRLRGKGGAGIGGGARGDALVTVQIAPHPLFRREGDTILSILPVRFEDAILGAKVELPTINGPLSVTIPKHSSSGKVLRLRGRGVRGRDGVGDHLAELRVIVPKTEDADLSAFLHSWRKGRDDPRPATPGGDIA